MITRRHHNNTGLRQIKQGKTRDQVAAMAQRILGPTPPGAPAARRDAARPAARGHCPDHGPCRA